MWSWFNLTRIALGYGSADGIKNSCSITGLPGFYKTLKVIIDFLIVIITWYGVHYEFYHALMLCTNNINECSCSISHLYSHQTNKLNKIQPTWQTDLFLNLYFCLPYSWRVTFVQMDCHSLQVWRSVRVAQAGSISWSVADIIPKADVTPGRLLQFVMHLKGSNSGRKLHSMMKLKAQHDDQL